MKNISLTVLSFFLFIPHTFAAKEIPMRSGYRHLKMVEFPKNRNGSLPAFIYSQSSASESIFLKELNKNQTLMIEAIRDSLKTGRVPMANSIWKRFVKSLNNNSTKFDLNNIIFWAIKEAYLGKRYELASRALLYKVLKDKVDILEQEKDVFKQVLKNCEGSSSCDYDTKDEIERTYDLWKRRTKIFDKELGRAEKKFSSSYDENDGHTRLVQYVGKLFFESAEAIVSE